MDVCVPVHGKLFDGQHGEGAVFALPIIDIQKDTLKSIIGARVDQLVYDDGKVEGFIDTANPAILESDVHILDLAPQILLDYFFESRKVGFCLFLGTLFILILHFLLVIRLFVFFFRFVILRWFWVLVLFRVKNVNIG